MQFSWGELRDDLERAARAIRKRWFEALPVLCLAALAWVFGEALGYREGSPQFVQLVGGVALVLGEAYVMRVFGPDVGLPVGEPRRSGAYLLWGALCTGWPVLLYAIVALVIALTVANAVPLLRPLTPGGSVFWYVLFGPSNVLLSIQGWAFSYVAVDGAAAPDAIANVLRALDRAALVRAVVIALLFALIWASFWYGLHAFAARFGALPGAAASALAYVVVYIITYAVLLTTRPAVPSITAVPYEASAAPS